MDKTGKTGAGLEDILRYREEIFLVCLGFSRDVTAAEDLCQDVYARACAKLQTIRNNDALKPWLFRIARNICLDHGRRSRIVRFVPLDADAVGESPEAPHRESGENDNRLALLKAAVGRLPVKLREVFVLRKYARLSYGEIARTLDIREGTVMSRLHRGRRVLVKIFGENHHDNAAE